MTRAIIRSQRPRRVIYTIPWLRRKVLEIFADCAKAYRIAQENPDEFYWRTSAISGHWTPIVRRILASRLPEVQELEGLNNLLGFLDLDDVELFLEAFPEQFEDVVNACANYTPFEPYWAEMEPVLVAYLQRMQGEEEEGEEEGEQMVIG
jgi:hypothetical protein